VPAEDVAELYARLAERLQRIVSRDVGASEVVIEDACQVAWSRFLRHRDRVAREAALTWLVRTAIHEAWRMSRRQAREVGFDATEEWESGFGRAGPGWCWSRPEPDPADVVQQRLTLGVVAALPERERRVLWMQALGFTHEEISGQCDETLRSVDRQLVRARKGLRDAGG
jgi:RNA polymerase sigma factor (sigma-70 family)